MTAFNPCLLIPVYNHAEKLATFIGALQALSIDILIIDDGSDEQHARQLKQLAGQTDKTIVIRQQQNQGKGTAVVNGIRRASQLGFTHALQFDADGQHDLNDIPPMLELAKKHPAALVSGKPVYDESAPRSRVLGRYLTHFWVWVETLSLDITDSMCGFRVYPVPASMALIEKHPIARRMDFDTDIMVRLYWDGVPVVFMPTRVRYPADGVSHFNLLKDNLRITRMHTLLVLGMLLRSPQLLWRKLSQPTANKLAHNNSETGQTPAQTHWASVKERGSVTGLWLVTSVFRLLGRRGLTMILYPVITWYFVISRRARHASQHFLQQVHRAGNCSQLQQAPNLGTSYRHFLAFGEAIADRFAAWGQTLSRGDVVFEQRDLLYRCKQSGRGAVIFTSHLGNADMARGLVNDADDLTINVLIYHDNADRINSAMKRVNPRLNITVISISTIHPGTIGLLHEKISAGEFVIIAADRTPASNPDKSIGAMFFKEQAQFPLGTFVLASLLECKVFLLFCIKQEQHTIYLEEFAERIDMSKKDRVKSLQPYVQRYANRLEYYCNKAPLQWFNFYNFWAMTKKPISINTTNESQP